MKAFRENEQLYEKFGKEDPFWAVLTQKQYKGTDIDLEKFFATGRNDISYHLEKIEEINLSLSKHKCLDFGCGVGRLSNALAEYFEQVYALDVSSSMIEKAESLRKHGNIEFVLNKEPNLEVFEDETFDFVFTDKTLQHIPYPQSKTYIAEFLRVLKPRGIIVFMVPDGRYYIEGSITHQFSQFYRDKLRPFFKKLRGKPPVQIHPFSKRKIEEIVAHYNGKILQTEIDQAYLNSKRRTIPTFYWVVRADRPGKGF